jgi:hypothetical protein
MHLKPHPYLIFFAIFISTFCTGQDIKLNDVAKIKVTTIGGSGFRDNWHIEVVNENGNWKSYQIRHEQAFNTDSSKRLIRNIPDNIISDLVDIINHPETRPVVSHYGFDETELLKYVDTISPALKSYQKAQFTKALQSQSVLQDALLEINTPEEIDHSVYCAITVVTKANVSFEISTYAFGYLDYAVWQHEKIKYFNPGIHKIFHFARLKDKETAGAKKRLYKAIAQAVYRKHLETKFNWADFKEDYPASFKLLNASLKPIRLVRSKNELIGEFSSSQFPGYITLGTSFAGNDIESITLIKRQEDTIVNICKKVKFLTDHYKSQPGARVLVSHQNDGHKQYFRFSMTSNNNNRSEWLVVDNKSVVLLNYSGQLKDPFSNKFEGIIPRQAVVAVNHQAYLIFDFDGNMIGGNKEVGKSDLIFK